MKPSVTVPGGLVHVADLVLEAERLGAYDLAGHVAAYGERLGFGDVVLYLADLQGKELVPFLPGGHPEPDQHASTLAIDSTLAGRVFQRLEILGQGDAHGRVRTWVPLVAHAERLGVLAADLQVSSETDEDEHRRVLGLFAAAAAQLVVTKQLHGDTLVRLRRTAPMGLAAEMQWGLLPPLAFADRNVSVAAALEPAYEVAGDSVDYAVDQDATRFAIFDGMGHGLLSAQLAAVVVAAYRNARRAGHSLTETWERVDAALEDAFSGEAFATGVLGQLDVATGTVTWISAGHPPPLVIRADRSVRSLESEPRLPLGIGLRSTQAHDGEDVTWSGHVGSAHLQPGDHLVLYTDGVVESRAPSGELFGVERLTDLLTKNLLAGMPASETLRRVVWALLRHQGAQLADDATLLVLHWQPPSGRGPSAQSSGISRYG